MAAAMVVATVVASMVVVVAAGVTEAGAVVVGAAAMAGVAVGDGVVLTSILGTHFGSSTRKDRYETFTGITL
jgi:hypothetical protein